MHVADLHCDTVMRMQAGLDISVANPAVQVDLPRLQAGNVGLQAFAAYVSPDTAPSKCFESAVSKITAIKDLCRDNPRHFTLVTDAEAAELAPESGLVGVMLTVENGQAIEDDLEKLEALREHGVRSMTLVHSKNTNWVASCTEESCDFDGLSEFGERVVDAMAGMGMIIDVSHAHEAAFWKVAKRTRRGNRPLIATHSNAWEICPHPRNLKDDQIREIAEQGGVIGINFFPTFLDRDYYAASKQRVGTLFQKADEEEKKTEGDPAAADKVHQKLGQTYQKRMADVKVTSESILRHIDHIAKVGGEDCISFGSDFDGILSTPEDVTGSDAYPQILRLLSERGFSDETIQKIAWNNFLRVLKAHD